MSDAEVGVFSATRRWATRSLSLRVASLNVVGELTRRIRESRRNQPRRFSREATPRRTPLNRCRSLQASGAGRLTGNTPQQRDEKSPQSRGAPQSWKTKESSDQRGTESESCSAASVRALDDSEMVMSEGPLGTTVAGPKPWIVEARERGGRDD